MCPLPLSLMIDIQIKSFCPISVNNIASNFIKQLNPNQYLLDGNTENNIISPPLAMINLPKSCTLYSTDFIIPSVNSFSSKMSTTSWGYQLDPFINKSDPLIQINFKIMSSFGLKKPNPNEIQLYSQQIATYYRCTYCQFHGIVWKQIDNATIITSPLGLS